MAKAKLKIPKVALPTKDETARLVELVHNRIFEYRGNADKLESAIGFFFVGKYFGWRVMYIVHSKKTVSQYEEILGIDVREEFPELGPYAERSLGWRAAKLFSNFWKVVSGEEKLPPDVGRQEFASPDA